MQVTLKSGEQIPRLGQGTWRMGESPSDRAREIASLRLGLDLGLTLIDTAEMYGSGGAEEIIAEAIKGKRDSTFIVSKAYPQNAGRKSLPTACENSLRRLATDRIDLYLLHWRGNIPLAETVDAFEKLRAQGKIRHWGVSNFDVDDMTELATIPGATNCAANQVLYNPSARGVEFGLIPYCATNYVAVMAYTPLGANASMLRNSAICAVAQKHNATPGQIAIAWSLRHPGVISIPKATDPDHVRANAAARDIRLTPDDEAAIDAAFPPPKRKRPLDML